MRRGEGDWLTEQLDLAGVRSLRAGQDLEQRRLAGAILAQERMNLRRPDFEMDILKREHAGKALADAGHLENRTPGVGDGCVGHSRFRRTSPHPAP
jgi:hypothetical protein